MSEFQERHADLITLVRLSKLTRELHDKASAQITEALENPTVEAVDEVLRALAEYQLVKNELVERIQG